MTKPLTIQDFFTRFPHNDACLTHLFELRFGPEFPCPKCGEIGKFRKLSRQPAYTCNCGHHVHPMVGTIFQDTHTPLTKWFYGVYLFTTSRHGVPAKELQRQLGVSYPTAFRMAHLIRQHMAKVDGNDPLDGHVEIDETMVGGVRSGGKRGRGAPGKTVVFGMLEREGDVITKVVPDVKRATLEPHIVTNVLKGATVSTDELRSYANLAKLGYDHGAVNHSKDIWVRGKHHTNSLEGFWSLVKRSISGTHVHVSRRHLSKYLGEFEFRWNSRHAPSAMFPALMASF
jgi:transposase